MKDFVAYFRSETIKNMDENITSNMDFNIKSFENELYFNFDYLEF
jgi:hypothetical protein